MKYVILGYSGAGKSTFGMNLSKLTNIPVTHLDQLYFNPNWVEVDSKLFEDRIQVVLKEGKWILEGNYSRFGKNKINESTTIFIFKFNRVRCFINLIKRRIKYNNKVRESVAVGCYETLDLKFIKYVMFDSRKKRRKIYYSNIENNYPQKVVIFKNHRQVNRYLNNFTKN